MTKDLTATTFSNIFIGAMCPDLIVQIVLDIVWDDLVKVLSNMIFLRMSGHLTQPFDVSQDMCVDDKERSFELKCHNAHG